MTPTEYLIQRVSKVILDSNKLFNEGARLLAHYPTWREDIDTIVNDAWDALLRYSIRSKNTTHSATVKLTFVSNLIGSRIAKFIGEDENNVKSTLALGDVLLESFLQSDLIEIFREHEGRKAPYLVRIKTLTDEIKPVLIGTTFEEPGLIKSLISPVTKEPFIKGWSNNAKFKQFLTAPFVKALEKLRNQRWKINKAVYTEALKNPAQTTIDLVDEDGEIHVLDITKPNEKLYKGTYFHMDSTPFLGRKDARVQRLFSKYYEYKQIITKASMILENGGEFFQEVSCDYRGRVYYAESFLEFQGCDLARSLFLFANTKKVTEDGYRWMMIHAANSYNQTYTLEEIKKATFTKENYTKYLKSEGLDSISVDKMTLEDRVNWSKENLGKIINDWSSNLDPLAEKPYAFLAVCNDIKQYMQHKEKGLDYYSGLPIPLDGSNNGDRLPL